MQIKLIRHGIEDDKLKTEYQKSLKNKKKSKALSLVDKVFSLIIALVVLVFFIFSSCVGINDNKVTGSIPTLQVVKSASMSKKHEKNTYLTKHNLNDHIQTFDLIVTHELPKESDLKLYDIVVYEVDNTLVVHRIVGIEEPNKSHPNERHFLLQGDNVETPDRFPVRYNQMKGIYKGERVPFIGSFITFIQSPAGYLVVALVIFAVIVLPIVDHKMNKEKYLRLVAIGFIREEENDVAKDEIDVAKDEIVATETEKTLVRERKINIVRSVLSFKERLIDSQDVVKERYKAIVAHVLKIKDIRVIDGKKQETFKKGNTPIIKLTIKGKTLNAYIGLNPEEYVDTKYIYSDVSNVTAHQNYPMRVKVSSERQTRWVKELIDEIIKKNGLTLLENTNELKFLSLTELLNKVEQSTEHVEEQPKHHLHLVRLSLTFKEKLEKANDVVKARYKDILHHLYKIKDVRAIDSKRYQSFKKGNKPIVKLTIKGKTLNAYLGLDPKEYTDTKYIYSDVSGILVHKTYPMRVKVTSDRQTRWVKELIDHIVEKHNLTAYAISRLVEIKGTDKTFKERLAEANNTVKQRYRDLVGYLTGIEQVKVQDFNKHQTFKKGKKPIAKVKIVGKTLNVYLAIDPKEYKNSKYKFIDASKIKAHQTHPMRFTITSDRKVKHVKELIQKITK